MIDSSTGIYLEGVELLIHSSLVGSAQSSEWFAGTGTPRAWTSRQEEAFGESKNLLASAYILAHFHRKTTALVTDTSPCGLGAILAQR